MIVIDTHALVWALDDNQRLGAGARTHIDSATRSSGLFISAITPWEIALAVSRGRLSLKKEVRTWIADALALRGVFLTPLSPSIAIDSVDLPGQFHADPADRIIVATAREQGLPLLTADRAILAYGAAGHLGVINAAL